ncbi:MAG: EAL domain-containing protein [Solirubrobacteraceae bacterium]
MGVLLEIASDAVVAADQDGLIVLVNASAEQMFGFTREELVGKPVEVLMPSHARASHVVHRLGYVADPEPRRLEVRAARRDGSEFPVEITLNTLATETGFLVVAAARDITERRDAEAGLARLERELQRLAEAAEYGSDSVISTDQQGIVRHWNQGAEMLYGYSAEEAVGRELRALIMIADESHEFERVLRGRSVSHFEVRHRRKDAALIDVLWRATPWHLDGHIAGVTGVAVDITERKRSERARERALQDLEAAQRLARIGSWSWDPSAEHASWSAQTFEIFARDPTQGPASRDAILACVHPEDRERVAAGYTELFGGGPDLELDVRIVLDGTERTLHARGHADPARPGCYVGTFQDVSEQRVAQQELRDAQERFRRTFEEAPIGMALISTEGMVEAANAALGSICARVRHELEGLSLAELVHPADAGIVAEEIRMVFAGEIEQFVGESRVVPAVGAAVEISIHGTVLRGGAGRPDRLLCQFQDITERKRFESRLQFMAEHDPLTGLANRRKFEAELERHIAQIKRYGPRGALLMLDIDNFESINDTLGHRAGDELISAIAGLLRERVRTSDVLARLGGDEFGVLLPQADRAEAAQAARALLSAVRSDTGTLAVGRRNVTASIGIAVFEGSNEGLSGERALFEGDLAMYDAKEAGRNRYAFFASTEHRTSRTHERLTWMSRIEHALQNDGFVLLAQPILDLRSDRVTQHELLLRMLDQDGALIPPSAFLNIAERFELIGQIDQWVVVHAIELIDRQPRLQLHVNISGKSLGDQRLLQTIDDLLSKSRFDPTHLTFEVTETAAIANITHAQTFAQRLRDRGCQLALDDFGSGFGSFYYLKHLPFDSMKIDGEFVQHAASGQINRLVIDAVVRVARGLRKTTVAEFVTSPATQEMVSLLGVDYAQGYHIGKPVALPDILDQIPAQPG